MQRATRLLPIALALAFSLAPAALANQHGGGGGTSAQGQMSGMHKMLPGGISFKGQLDHAYSEALNAQEALALGMTEMAANHLDNVDMTLGHLEQAGGMSPGMRDQVAAIRRDAANLKGNLGDRAQAIQQTAQLAGRFSTFYNQMAATMPTGGGGGAQLPMQSPAELMGGATRQAAQAQSSLVTRNWEVANLHARDVVAHLEQAERAARMAGMQANSRDIQHMRTLRTEAGRLVTAIGNRSKDAVKQAGTLVTRLGAELVHVADATRGGGAGMQQEPMPQR